MVPATLLVVLGLLTFLVAHSVRTYRSLSQFGGHWSAGWARLWLLRTQSSGEMNKIFTDINRKHGE